MAGSTLFLRRVAGRARRELAYLTIRRDLARWRRESRGLRSARPRAADEGVALIISLSDFVFSLKLEAMIATALRLAGYRVVVLTLPNARWARAYLGAAGVEEFVTPVEDIPADLVAEARAAAAAAHAANPGVQELKDFEYRGAYVGQQAISTLSRTFERGRISFDDKDVRAALAKLLPEAVQSTVAADLLLDRVRPGLVVFNEKGYAGYGSIYDLALRRGANVVQFVAAGIHTRDALLFKRYTLETRRIHPASLSRDSWEKARAMPWTPQREAALEREFAVRYDSGEKHPDAGLQEGKELKSAEDVRRQLGLDPAKPTAIVFSHVLWDANLFYGDDLFADQETWLVETVKAACANPAANWVVKLHPANMYKARAGELNDETAIREAIGELPPHVKLLHPQTDINTYSLFAVADAAVTIRGTIGMEVPCFGVPVLTAGTGRYSGLGFTIDSATPEEYLDRLARIQELPRLDDAAVLLAKRHAYALFRLRAFVFSSYRASFASAARLAHPLSHNLRLTRRTQAQVEGAPDLRELGEWLADPSLLDYLASPTSSRCGARGSPSRRKRRSRGWRPQYTGSAETVRKPPPSTSAANGAGSSERYPRPRLHLPFRDDGYVESFGDQWQRWRTVQLDSAGAHQHSRERLYTGTGWTREELAGERILEAGCGAGRFTEVLLEAGAYVTAVDASSAVEICLANNGPSDRLRVLQADIMALPFAANSFDRVFCFGVLQHTPDPQATFLALVRQLRPGGTIAADCYRTLPYVDRWSAKLWWRPLTTRLPRGLVRRVIEWYVPRWLPIDTRLARVPRIGRFLVAIVPCWNYTGLLDLGPDELVAWAILDTFDALTPRYDRPQTVESVQAWCRAAGLVDINVRYGGNGVLINARKAS